MGAIASRNDFAVDVENRIVLREGLGGEVRSGLELCGAIPQWLRPPPDARLKFLLQLNVSELIGTATISLVAWDNTDTSDKHIVWSTPAILGPLRFILDAEDIFGEARYFGISHALDGDLIDFDGVLWAAQIEPR